MLKKNNLIFLTLIFSSHLWAKDCKVYPIKYLENGKTVSKKESMCLETFNKKLVASSENCIIPIDKKCPFHEMKNGPAYNTFINEIGSPQFNLCQYLKGTPQMYQIELDGKWKSYERCIWNDNKEFADLEQLSFFYKSNH